MGKKTNVLIFPAGSEIGIEIYNSIKYNLHFNVYGASGKRDHAKFLYPEGKYFEGAFFVDSPGFLDLFNHLLVTLEIDYIFPTHDTVALFLSENQARIRAIPLVSPYATARVAREKKLTYELFASESFCPVVYGLDDEAPFPVFVKPNRGQGGKEAFLAKRREDLDAIEALSEFVLTEFLPGDELSVDCFTDKDRKLLFVGPRTRGRVQMGISFNSKSQDLTDEVKEIAVSLNNALVFRGAWFFQLKRDKNGKYKLLEFAVRQASTMGLFRQAGVNFALLTLFDRMGLDVSIIRNSGSLELDRCLENRFRFDFSYKRVYIDLDDTIIVNESVNEDAIKYIYNCRNRDIEVVLLTKHKHEVHITLSRYCISERLFDRIIHIGMDEDKANFIQPEGAIFIDNYFIDRFNVLSRFNIPVFDVDAIPSLIA